MTVRQNLSSSAVAVANHSPNANGIAGSNQVGVPFSPLVHAVLIN